MNAGKVIVEFTMSLDGFIAGPNDEIDQLFRWYTSGDTEFKLTEGGMAFKVSKASADLPRANWGAIGAVVTGRRDFDVSDAWGGKPPFDVPMFIVTHSPPQEWVKEGSPFMFVTGGVDSAVEQAKRAAGNMNVGIGGTKITQQALQAGLVDEIQIHLAPMLLGTGIRLFDGLGAEPIDLERVEVVDTPDVTHLRFRVVK